MDGCPTKSHKAHKVGCSLGQFPSGSTHAEMYVFKMSKTKVAPALKTTFSSREIVSDTNLANAAQIRLFAPRPKQTLSLPSEEEEEENVRGMNDIPGCVEKDIKVFVHRQPGVNSDPNTQGGMGSLRIGANTLVGARYVLPTVSYSQNIDMSQLTVPDVKAHMLRGLSAYVIRWECIGQGDPEILNCLYCSECGLSLLTPLYAKDTAGGDEEENGDGEGEENGEEETTEEEEEKRGEKKARKKLYGQYTCSQESGTHKLCFSMNGRPIIIVFFTYRTCSCGKKTTSLDSELLMQLPVRIRKLLPFGAEYSKKGTAITFSTELTNGFEFDVVHNMGASMVMKKVGSILKNCYNDNLNDYLGHIASWKNVDREQRMQISFVDFPSFEKWICHENENIMLKMSIKIKLLTMI